MRILVTGGEGFIGRQIAVALRGCGHEVICGVRRPADSRSILCDFSRDRDPESWAAALETVDVVVNAVGILRESGANRFERVHVTGPQSLFRGCQAAGVRRVIQISALGAPESGDYVASKHRGDAALAALDLDWTIVRPSLVYSVNGSYGGTSLLRAMAAVPWAVFVLGSGDQLMQPIRAEDLALLVVRLIERHAGIRAVVAAVGPAQVTLLHYLLSQRRWLDLPEPRIVRVPLRLALLGAWLGEHFSKGPLGMTMWRMLNRGNVASDESAREMVALDVHPIGLQAALDSAPSFVQDRWHARLYFLGPLLRIALGILWIGSAVAGWHIPRSQSEALLGSVGIPAEAAGLLVGIASAVDFVLGVLALVAWRPSLVAGLMIASLLIYTAFVGILFPGLWLEPFGGLLKNLPLIPAALVMGVLSRRR